GGRLPRARGRARGGRRGARRIALNPPVQPSTACRRPLADVSTHRGYRGHVRRSLLRFVHERVVIIGGGIAGQSVCEDVRARDPEVAVTLLCAEPRLPYDRVVLSHLLSGEASEEDLQLRPAEWYADRGIDVRVGARARRLDPAAGACELDDSTSLPFDRAVICTGSDPLVPPIPGTGLRRVHVFRGPED